MTFTFMQLKTQFSCKNHIWYATWLMLEKVTFIMYLHFLQLHSNHTFIECLKTRVKTSSHLSTFVLGLHHKLWFDHNENSFIMIMLQELTLENLKYTIL